MEKRFFKNTHTRNFWQKDPKRGIFSKSKSTGLLETDRPHLFFGASVMLTADGKKWQIVSQTCTLMTYNLIKIIAVASQWAEI